MKTKIILLLICICCLQRQIKSQGLFLRADDYKNHRLAFQKQQGKKYKFHLNQSANKKYFTIRLGDSLFRFSKDSVFGYKDKHLINYRFFKRESYKILNATEGILLYSKEHLGGNKGSQTIIDYFFSKGCESPIYKLTRHNLKQVYVKEESFLDLIDISFLNEEDFMCLDSETGLYKINLIFQKSQKK